MNHVDWAASEREKLPDKAGYYTKEEAIEASLEHIKKEKLVDPVRIRVWKHRWKKGEMAEKLIKKILELGRFQKAVTWYRKVSHQGEAESAAPSQD